jgi:deoxyribodipyrimidine photo-lyase
VFNPILQGEKFDPYGAYVRRWVPELAQLPASVIHRPWSAAPLELADAAVDLGKTYPKPFIDHKKGANARSMPMRRSKRRKCTAVSLTRRRIPLS